MLTKLINAIKFIIFRKDYDKCELCKQWVKEYKLDHGYCLHCRNWLYNDSFR